MDGELLSLKWNNHRTTFLHVIGSLRNKAAYTDATLACEGKFYPVHRLVLSTCSEYFGAIFEKTPCKSPVVVLKDIECKNLEFLLDYMYIGEVNVRQNELAALIRAAECLRIKGLAVPDEDPSLSTCNSSKERLRSESHRDSSPPAKRRRNRQFSNDERKYKKVNQNIEGSVIESSETNNIESQSNIPIKLEPTDLDSSSEGNFQDQAEDNIDELRSDEGGGTEDNDRENTSTELQEFFKCTVEKEEPISLSDYSSDFAGPSGVQNSNITPWESESSFATEVLPLGTSNSGTTPADSQHQQQMFKSNWIVDENYTSKFEAQDRGHVLKETERLGLSNFGAKNICTLPPIACSSKKPPSTTSNSFLDLLDPSPLIGAPSILYEGDERPVVTANPPIRRHKIHQCEFCSYSTMKKSNYIVHRRVHTGEKPFKCSFCNYRSAEKARIKIHQRRHTGEKPYNCSYCSYRASTPSCIKHHMLNKHFIN